MFTHPIENEGIKCKLCGSMIADFADHPFEEGVLYILKESPKCCSHDHRTTIEIVILDVASQYRAPLLFFDIFFKSQILPDLRCSTFASLEACQTINVTTCCLTPRPKGDKDLTKQESEFKNVYV
jgi:hypothetical protein